MQSLKTESEYAGYKVHFVCPVSSQITRLFLLPFIAHLIPLQSYLNSTGYTSYHFHTTSSGTMIASLKLEMNELCLDRRLFAFPSLST
jgi:hypothetical protein